MAESAAVVLCVGGDVALGGALQAVFTDPVARADRAGCLAPQFAAADIGFVSLDCALDTRGAPPEPDEYLVAADPAGLAFLVAAGVHVVSLASNHATDFGPQSLAATQRHLDRHGLIGVGAGDTLSAARQLRIVCRRGVRIGFLAYASTHPWVGARPATPERGGTAPLDAALVAADIRAARRQVEHLVVSMHWGKENLHYPAPEVRRLGRQVIEWGGDVVVGHHPHVVQGHEAWERGVIFYSLGNLLYPDYPEQALTFSGPQRESVLAHVELSPAGARVARLTAMVMADDGRVTELALPRREAFQDHWRLLCAALARPDYERLWQRQVRRAEVRRLWRVLQREVISAGWRDGARRLSRLGRKNLRSVGRSLAEIVGRSSGR